MHDSSTPDVGRGPSQRLGQVHDGRRTPDAKDADAPTRRVRTQRRRTPTKTLRKTDATAEKRRGGRRRQATRLRECGSSTLCASGTVCSRRRVHARPAKLPGRLCGTEQDACASGSGMQRERLLRGDAAGRARRAAPRGAVRVGAASRTCARRPAPCARSRTAAFAKTPAAGTRVRTAAATSAEGPGRTAAPPSAAPRARCSA